MNILLLNWRDPKNPKAGGAEIVTYEYAKAWTQAGHQVTWVCEQFPGGAAEEHIEGIRIVRRGTYLTLFFIIPLYYFFTKKHYDLVVDEIHGIPYFTPLFVKKSKKLTIIHEVAGDIWDAMYPFPLNIIGKTVEHVMFRYYRNIPFITVSNSTKRELEARGIKKITVIQNGISLSPLNSIPKKEHIPTFLFVSRLVKMKGIEDVITAFALIQKELPTTSLWLIGAGEPEYTRKLKEFVKQDNLTEKIQFLGKISEKEKVSRMQRAHLLLHASIKEGWGLVVTEAASQATPSIVYNVGGLRDAVKNGQTGVVLSRNTPEAMAQAALTLIQAPKQYRALQQNCLDYARTLTWNKAAKESLKVIEHAN